MENCLVKKLKSSVENSELVKLGHIRFLVTEKSITNTEQQLLHLQASKDITVTVIGDGYFGEDSVGNVEVQKLTTLTIPASTSKNLYVKNGNYIIDVDNKYSLKIIHFGQVANGIVSMDIEDVEFSTLLNYLRLGKSGSFGSIEKLSKLTNLITLDLSSCNVSGDIPSLNTLTSLTNLNVSGNESIGGSIDGLTQLSSVTALSFGSTNISGTAEGLGNFTSLTTCYPNVEKMGGTIEGFVSTQIANGKTTVQDSSAIFIGSLLRFATFGGTIQGGNASNFICWESASKIAVFKAGATVAQCTGVVVKGYTQSEAETRWPGKTVTVIS